MIRSISPWVIGVDRQAAAAFGSTMPSDAKNRDSSVRTAASSGAEKASRKSRGGVALAWMRNSDAAPVTQNGARCRAIRAVSPLRRASPRRSRWANAGSSKASMAARPAAMDSGLAENVPPWGTGGCLPSASNTAMASRLPPTAPIGRPPPMTLPMANRSGASP